MTEPTTALPSLPFLRLMTHAPAATALVALALLSPASSPAAQLVTEVEGGAAYDSLGHAVSGGFDVDGDGTPDLVVGLPRDALLNASATGQVVAVSGADGTELHTLNGVGSTDQFGDAVAGIGDVDGDGVPDYVAGAASACPGGVGGAGQARVVSGADGSVIHDLAGPGQGSFCGRSVAGIADVDGDDVPDFAVGCVGFATVHSGATGDVVYTLEHPDTSFGWAVAAAGDVDGDGEPDLIVGAPGSGSGGEAFVYSGPTGTPIHTISGGVSSSALQGWAASALFDVDRDGRDEFLVSAPKHIGFGGQQGIVRAFSGATGLPLWSIEGADAGTFLFGELGDTLDGIDDVDGDGVPDVVAGAPGSAKVAWLSGADGSVIEIVTGSVGDGFAGSVANVGDVDGDATSDVAVGATNFGNETVVLSGDTFEEILSVTGQTTFGEAVAGLGDADGDLVPDLVVGAPSAFPTGPGEPGGVVVVSGETGELLHLWDGATADDRFGFAVQLLGDVDGDGSSDVAVGAPRADLGGIQDAGEVVVFSGADGSVLRAHAGTTAGESLGAALARLPDLDGDGVPDLAIGAPGTDEVLVHSGSSGALLHTLASSELTEGMSIAAAADHDGDGVGEILVGAPDANDEVFNGPAGRVEVFSGAGGGKIFTWNGVTGSGEELGTSVAGGIDWNDDGVPDVFAGAPHFDGPGMTSSGRVKVFSGLDGILLDTLEGSRNRGLFGRALAILEDADGDGMADLAVGAPSTDLGGAAFPGEVFVRSGASHRELAAFTGPAFFDRFGWSLSAAGDASGDGLGDLVVGLPGLAVDGGEQAGAARVLRLADGPVVPDLGGPKGTPGPVADPLTPGATPVLVQVGGVVELRDAPPNAAVTLLVTRSSRPSLAGGGATVPWLHVAGSLVTGADGSLSVPVTALSLGGWTAQVRAIVRSYDGATVSNTVTVHGGAGMR